MRRNAKKRYSARGREWERERERTFIFLVINMQGIFHFVLAVHMEHTAYGRSEEKKAVGLTDFARAFFFAWWILILLLSLFSLCLQQRFCTNKVLVIFVLFSLWLPEIFITQNCVYCIFFCTLHAWHIVEVLIQLDFPSFQRSTYFHRHMSFFCVCFDLVFLCNSSFLSISSIKFCIF